MATGQPARECYYHLFLFTGKTKKKNTPGDIRNHTHEEFYSSFRENPILGFRLLSHGQLLYKSVCLLAGIKSVFTALSAPLNVPGIFFIDGPFFFVSFFFFFFFFYTHKNFCRRRSVLFSLQSFLRWSCPASSVRCVRGSPSDTCSSLAHQLCSSSSLTDRTAAADPSTTPSTSITSNSKFFVTTCNNFHRKTRRKDASLCKRETSIILQRFFARTCCSHRSFLLLLSFWNFPRAVFRRVDKIRALRRRPTRGIEVALFFARRNLFSSFLLLLNFAARKSVVTIFLLLWTLLTDADRLTRSPSWKRTSAPVPPSRIFCSGITALII